MTLTLKRFNRIFSKHRLKKKFRFLWVTDAWKSLDHPKDTTLRLIEESWKLGFQNDWCDVKSIHLEHNQVRVVSRPILRVHALRNAKSFEFGPQTQSLISDFNSIQYRVDPPIDHSYLHPLQLLSLGVQVHPKTTITNPPEILFKLNEKFGALLLGHLYPPSVVSTDWPTLMLFGKREGIAVLKPLHQAQSKGVELVHFKGHRAIQSTYRKIRLATDGFKKPILLQRYLKEIHQGETRLWFLDGKLLAHVRKFPPRGSFRMDLDRGGNLKSVPLTAGERRACTQISQCLRTLQIRLAAVDLIGAQITDFNVTSPGLLVQIEKVFKTENLAQKVIQALATPLR